MDMHTVHSSTSTGTALLYDTLAHVRNKLQHSRRQRRKVLRDKDKISSSSTNKQTTKSNTTIINNNNINNDNNEQSENNTDLCYTYNVCRCPQHKPPPLSPHYCIVVANQARHGRWSWCQTRMDRTRQDRSKLLSGRSSTYVIYYFFWKNSKFRILEKHSNPSCVLWMIMYCCGSSLSFIMMYLLYLQRTHTQLTHTISFQLGM